MSTKIYLSPAAHEHDNACAQGGGCTENRHCNAYMDELEAYLKACGFEIKRGSKTAVGSAEVQRRVREANAWGADLYYVCHTNAFNGTVSGSRPYVYPTGAGRQWAETLLSWRRKVYPYACSVKTTTDLYEVLQTKMVTIYEELVFHDNREDAAFLHNNLRVLAEYTARGLCEIFGRAFVDPYAVVPGDVTGDGKVSVSDARKALRAVVGKETLTAEQVEAADINGDGKVSTADVRKILRKSVGKE